MLLLSACSENGINRVTATDEFLQAPTNKADILWVIDNSVSMGEEQAAVSAAATAFLAQMETANVDFHLGAVTTDMSEGNASAGVLLGSTPYLTSACLDDGDASDCSYPAEFAALVQQGTEGDGIEKGLGAALAAVSEPLASRENAGFVRDDALLSIIFLTDENDCTDHGALGAHATADDCYGNADKLVDVHEMNHDLYALKLDRGGAVLHGIIGPDNQSCPSSAPGLRYITAIEAFGGVQASICTEDYGSVMDKLGLAASGVLDTFQLSKAADPDSIRVEVDPEDAAAYDVEQDDAEGWSYLEDHAQLHFNGDSVPPRGSVITITYTVAGEVPDSLADTGTTGG